MPQDNLLFGFCISLIGLAFLVINSILFLFNIKQGNKPYKIFTLYLCFLSIEEIACNYIGFTQIMSNTFLAHINFNIQLLFLSILFYHLFTNTALKKTIIWIYIIIVLGLTVQFINNPELFWQFNVPEIAVISIVLICYGLIHIYNSIGESKNYFYFAIGLVMFLLCSTVIYMSGKYELVFWHSPLIDIWIFNSLFFIVFQYFILKEWQKQRKS